MIIIVIILEMLDATEVIWHSGDLSKSSLADRERPAKTSSNAHEDTEDPHVEPDNQLMYNI